MNYILPLLMAFSFFCAASTGNMSSLSGAIISGGGEAIELSIKLLGVICFWNGLMRVAEKSGLTSILCKCLSPILRFLFPGLDDEKTKNAIAMNMTANFLGLGSAATPFGLEAMKRLNALECKNAVAGNNTVRFVVINSAALHLVPTTVALLRKNYGSSMPMATLLPGLAVSLCALTLSLLLTVVAERIFKFNKSEAKKRK